MSRDWRGGERRSLCARLHPKPQIEVKYEQVDRLGVFQSGRVGIVVTNLSHYTLTDFRYPVQWK